MITFSNWKSRPLHFVNAAVQKQYRIFFSIVIFMLHKESLSKTLYFLATRSGPLYFLRSRNQNQFLMQWSVLYHQQRDHTTTPLPKAALYSVYSVTVYCENCCKFPHEQLQGKTRTRRTSTPPLKKNARIHAKYTYPINVLHHWKEKNNPKVLPKESCME